MKALARQGFQPSFVRGSFRIAIVWDVCLPPPGEIKEQTFDSIISHAQLEHVLAPTIALINFFTLLKSNELVFLLTATPSFHYHAYPRDYVRFHHDYFHDLSSFVYSYIGIKVELLELYSSQGIVCACYRKM